MLGGGGVSHDLLMNALKNAMTAENEDLPSGTEESERRQA